MWVSNLSNTVVKSIKLLIVSLLLLIPIVSASQNWKKIGQFDGKITSGYFFSSKSGIVSFVRGKSPVIARTTNGGVTWQESALTPEISIFEGFLSCIHMRDSLVGYASAYALSLPSYYKDGVWFTLDGGANWFSNKDSSQWVSLTTLPNGKLVTSQGGIAFKDSLIGIQSIAAPPISPYRYQSMYITSDGALTWKQIPNAPNKTSECWGLCYSIIFDAFYIASEAGSSIAYQINRTTNFGSTWDRVSPLPAPIGSLGSTGDIQCHDSSIYIQTIGSGMYRSRDGGLTWKNIGGPSNDYDTRFCVPPSCKGSLVVAFSVDGQVWITENGGDGELSPAPKIEITHIQNFKDVSSCTIDTALLLLKYRGCGTISFDSVSLSNSGVSIFSLDTTNTISTFLEDYHSDTIVVIFKPNGNVGNFTTDIRIRANMGIDEYNRLLDTSITLQAKSIPNPPRLTITELQINLGTASTCNQARDTVISLRNTGCDTLCITQGPGALPSEFTINSLSYPYCLPPDSSVTINVRFTPSGTGTFRAYPKYRAEQQGLSQDIELFLEGTGIEEGGELAYEPKAFTFPLTSICSQDSAFGFITNIGCDTLILENTSLTGDIDFTSTTIGSNTLIAPGDTLRYRILFMPSVKGNRSGQLVLTSKNNLPSRRDTIPITATVTDGTRILSSSPTTLDFGTTTLCQERDSIITLSNTGCDTLIISDISILGNGFKTDVIKPIIIPPNGSINIPVSTVADTSQGNISTGTITFTSDADNQIAPITLSRGYTYPKSYSFHIGMLQASGTSDEIVRLAIVGEQGLGSAGSGVNQLDFDLSLNEDLLEYITAEGQNTVTKNGNHITIIHPNELTSDNDTLAILRYHVYLTKDSATDITVSNVSINIGDTSSCAPKIAASTQAGFTYRYECGDKSIQSFLRNGQASLTIISVKPNPAKDEVRINLRSEKDRYVTLRVIDISGKVMIELPKHISAGEQEITFETASLAEGSYVIEITTSGGAVQEKLLIQR